MITADTLFEFLTIDFPYKHHLVYAIDGEKEYPLFGFNEIHRYENSTIKIEGLEKYSKELFDYSKQIGEKYSHQGPITVHGFISNENSPNFGSHTDPDDVVILCIEGTKLIEVEDTLHTLTPGDCVYIPANTAHKPINKHYSVILSFGLEHFFEEKLNALALLSKNN